MSLLVTKAKEQIKNSIIGAVNTAIEKGELENNELTAFSVEVPANREHGDYAVNAAMVWARLFHKAPRQIAEIIVANCDFTDTYIKSCEIAGPGFINFFLNDSYYADIVLDIEEKGADYGKSNYGEGKKVLVEFVSANPTGPMHIGNARGGALGDCLAAVLEAAGYYTEREFYINDAGNQINKFGLSLDLRYLQLYKEGIEMPEDAYHGEDIVNHAKNFAEINGDKYVEADSEERRQALCDYALPINIENLEKDLGKYRITYDRWFKESELHGGGAVAEIIEKLKESGYTYETDGALWFKSSELGDDKDRVLVRENGIPTYFVPDIAYHYNKLVTRKFDTAIDILGADHHGYIPRMKAAMQALGVNPDRLDMVIMQMVNLIKDGEKYKLSKRSGKAITLSTLLEEIPIDAARFFFNLREPNSHFDFDLDLAVSQTSQNPVYYVQYAHARICSIFRGLEEEGVKACSFTAEMAKNLKTAEERELIKYIATLPNVVNESAKAYDPAKMTRYAVEIATMFHKFYSQCRVKGESEEIMQARLGLCGAVKQIIKNILDMLKITCPESM